jgi:hypothetical protein
MEKEANELMDRMLNEAQKTQEAKPVTGDEAAYPGKMYGQQEEKGITLRQLVLKDFMCALIAGLAANPSVNGIRCNDIADKAADFTNVYFEQLNKN